MPFEPGYYKICTDRPFTNVKWIYPQKQKDVSRMIHNIKDYNNIEYILIFGSSTSKWCTKKSDIDVYIKCRDNLTMPEIYNG